MNALILLIATAATGIEVGWEPLPGGGHEYTIQIEPQLLKVLEQGHDEIYSEVPQGVDVRRYRIVVGVGKLERDYGPLGAAAAPAAQQPPAAAQRAPAAPQQAPAARQAPAAAPAPPPAAPDFGQPTAEEPPPEPVADPFASPPAAEPQAAPADRYGTVDEGPLEPVTEPGAAAEAAPTEQPHDPFAAPPDGATPAAAAPDLPGAGTGNAPAETAAPADPWGDSAQQEGAQNAAQHEGQGRAETLTVSPEAATAKAAPGKLPPGDEKSASLATFAKGEQSPAEGTHETGKPELDEVPRPWTALLLTLALLGCSIGGNIYLAWIARDARARYRSAVAKFRGAPA